jgi:hypothetical protein
MRSPLATHRSAATAEREASVLTRSLLHAPPAAPGTAGAAGSLPATAQPTVECKAGNDTAEREVGVLTRLLPHASSAAPGAAGAAGSLPATAQPTAECEVGNEAVHVGPRRLLPLRALSSRSERRATSQLALF